MYVRRGMGQITDAQSAANCAAGGGTYNSVTGDCVAPPGGSLYQGQLGTPGVGSPANNCANNGAPGGSGDVNCPFWCMAMPDFMWPASCWPCANICPTGTNFDTTNNVCSANPTTTNCKQGGGVVAPGTNPATAPSGCPSYCSLPLTSSLAACIPCAGANPASATQGLLVVGGFVLLGVLAAFLVKR
jgi:hypothetical protein